VAASKYAGKYAGICFAGAILAGCALGLAGNAQADCDPLMLSMTPQPVLSCQAPDVAPPPEQAVVAPVAPPAEPGPFGDVQAAPLLPAPDGSVD
jgi:hypothetical protein